RAAAGAARGPQLAPAPVSAGALDPPGAGPVQRPSRGGGIWRFTARRLRSGLGTLIFVLVINFFIFQLLPGDPLARYKGAREIDPADLAKLREELDAPMWQQFFNYLKDPLQLDSYSTIQGKPVWDVIAAAVPWTLFLIGTATIVATVIGIWIGIRAGWNRGGQFDKTSTGITLFLYATPEFWLGLILILLFSTGIGPFPGIFPSGSSIASGLDPWTFAGILSIAWHTVLPAAALAAVYLADYSLIMRASMVDELGQDYLMTARAKGLMDKAIRRGHAVPNASLPTVTLIFLNIGFIIGGAITVETVFSYPGLGLLTFKAIENQDTPLLQALFLLFSVSVLVCNVIADIVIAVIDPRIRL
ncbi:MAG: ABC transporter permease, partial [Actinomycetia bacterium]|nr:ABC transporter permease [Actinomycetes bacterium]